MIVRSLTLILAAGFFLCCSETDKKSSVVSNNKSKITVQEGWDSKLIISKAGHRQAEVLYGHMVKYKDEDIVFFNEGVNVDFFDKQGDHTSHLTADQGEYHEKSEDVYGIGNVVVVSDSGAMLMTEELRWDNKRGKILSDTNVVVVTEKSDTLWGVGFESNADLTRRVIRQARGVSQESIDIEALEKSFEKNEQNDTSLVRQKNGGDYEP